MPGGKAFQKKLIVPKFPAHDLYIEPFVGGGSIFFSKEPAKREIINDKDNALSGFYKYIQDHPHPPKFPFAYCSRAQFDKMKAAKPNTADEKFIQTFVLQQASFRANRTNFAPSVAEKFNFRNCNFLKNYDWYHERLQGVTILNKDYREVVKEYDTPEAFIYLDPPYETGESHDVSNASSQGDWYGQVKLEDIKQLVDSVQGKFMISFSKNEQFIRMMNDYTIEIYETRKMATRPAAWFAKKY